jgi:hypothetical protein
LKLLLITLFFSTHLFANSSQFTPYVLQKGDTVSEVLADYEIGPLYVGKKWENKVLELNRLSKETAKKLEPGDAILIPKASYFYSDDIKTMKSSWQKSQREAYKAPKTYNFLVSGGYFYQDFNFASTDSVSTNQNFFVNARYKERDIKSLESVIYNPNIEIGFYTQSNAHFSNNQNRVAEFTPSGTIHLGYEIEWRKEKLALNPSVGFESFTSLVFEDNDYDVNRFNVTWANLELEKAFYINDWRTTVSIYSGVGNAFGAQRFGSRLSGDFLNHYVYQVDISQTNLTNGDEFDIRRVATSFGYRF